MTEPNDSSPWEETIVEIAREWLLGDLPLGELPERAILPFENPDLHDPAPFLEHLRDVRRHRTIHIGTTAAGARVVLANSKFGAPAVAMLTHVLARSGVREMVSVGFGGGLDEALECGDLFVPVGAVRDDGTTARYVPESYPAVADPSLRHAILQSAAQTGAAIHEGLVLSTDAILLESTAMMRTWRDRGVGAVDMETGAFLTIARLLGARAATVLVASDHPVLCRRTDPQALGRGMHNAIEAAFNVFR